MIGHVLPVGEGVDGQRVARGQGALEGVGQSRLAHPRFPKQHDHLPLPPAGAFPEAAE
jgi:hypothetical protein